MNISVDSIINQTLTITIIDDDNFYMAGLVMVLSTYFKNKKWKVKFIPWHSITGSVDITFQAIRCGTFIDPRNQYNANSSKLHYFTIVDKRDLHLQHLYRDVEKNNTIYRHQSVNTLLQLIEKNFSYRNRYPENTCLNTMFFSVNSLPYVSMKCCVTSSRVKRMPAQQTAWV